MSGWLVVKYQIYYEELWVLREAVQTFAGVPDKF
jgi:hypothetical protein